MTVSFGMTLSAADVCSDLAKLSCAPGEFNDGTGRVKSEEAMQTELSNFAEGTKEQIKNKFSAMIADSNNSYFRDIALSALGLKGNPICESTAADSVAQCNKNLVEGLSLWAQRISLGKLLPTPSLNRDGNFRDLSVLLKDAHFNQVVRDVKEDAVKKLVPADTAEKIKTSIFPKVKAQVIARIKELPIEAGAKKFMISKVASVTFSGTKCERPAGSNINFGMGDSVADMLVPNAFYSPNSNSLLYCGGSIFQSDSEFEIVDTLAHELAHSIDPCNIADGPADVGFKFKSEDLLKQEVEYPLSNILQCLRTKESISAKNYRLEDKKPATADASDTANDTAPNFCDDDQVGESFCDWIAAETLPRYMEKNHKLTREQYRLGYMNAFKPICIIRTEKMREEREKPGERSDHPMIEDRINRILAVNPKVREQMGCSASTSPIYCDPHKTYKDPYLTSAEDETKTGGEQKKEQGADAAKSGVNK